jgi:tetratricopeptide (TPR) repeat protein
MLKKYQNQLILAFVMLFFLQLYVYTLFPAYKNNDSPETITTSYTLGIGHPPSYPLHTMLAKVFSMIPVGGPAFRINLFSVFLALLVLVVVYYIIIDLYKIIFGYENRIITYISMFVLAFSTVFWNQSIEAKGGIYVLNLLFLALMILISIRLFTGYDRKYLYLLAYVFGLALTNHWPSVIILLPVFLYPCSVNLPCIKVKDILTATGFILLGLSAYLYLPLRSSTNGVFVFMVKPNSWNNFWWTILRSGYDNNIQPSVNVYMSQTREFISAFAANFGFIWPFILPGIYVCWKTSKQSLLLFSAIFIAVTIAVLGLNRSPEEMLWVIPIFSLPAYFAVFFFVAVGAAYIVKLIKIRMLKNAVIVIMSGLVLYTGYQSFLTNNSRYDFMAYDFGNNVAGTLKAGNSYLSEGDYYNMPFTYTENILKSTRDIRFFNLYASQYQWGREKFNKDFGQIDFKQGENTQNIENMIRIAAKTGNVFISYYAKAMDVPAFEFRQRPYGLLYEMTGDNKIAPVGIFEKYAYRGIFERAGKYDRGLAAIYGERMAAQALDCLNKGKYSESIELFRQAAVLPAGSNEKKGMIYYSMFFPYRYLLDADNQLLCLINAIKYMPTYWPAYQEAGKIYYAEKCLPMAREMFDKAVLYGSTDKEQLKKYISGIDAVNLDTQLQALYNQGVAFLAAGKPERALDIFGYFLSRKTKVDEINMNLGVYYFKNNNLREAIKYFVMSNKINPTPKTYMNIAFAYYKLNDIKGALATLKDGLKIFNGDVGMMNMYSQIEKAGEQKH